MVYDRGRGPALLALAASVAACWMLSGTAFEAAKVKIRTHHDENFSFSGVRTWNWSPDGFGQILLGTTSDADPERLRDRVEPVLVPLVEREMAARGFTKTADNPAVLVNYFVLVVIGQSSQYMGQFAQGLTDWALPPIQGATQSMRVFPVGTVLIDVVSPATKAVVWRGAAQSEIDLERKPEERRARLERAVRDILKQFPPKDPKKR